VLSPAVQARDHPWSARDPTIKPEGHAMSIAASNTMSTVATAVKDGVITNFGQIVLELSQDGLELVGQEAEDFGNLVDDFTQDIEAGQSPAGAWSSAYRPFLNVERSQLWQDAVNALQQCATWFDSVIKAIEAAL
jgi:hypothetical protein